MAGLLLPTLTAWLGSTLLLRAAAHQCSDGSRVRCTDVIAKPDSPSTYGQGFGAHGSAHCTPSGEKVFCLVDHDYHRCSGDQLPCCSDGSDPHHSRHYSGSSSPADTSLVCGGAAKSPEPPSQPSATLLAKMTQLSGPSAGSSVLKEGSLVLSVSLKTPASGSSAGISQILVMHDSAAIRVGLASNFEVSLAAVKVTSLKLLARRRLLDVLDGPQKFKIFFTAELPEGIVETARSRPLAADLKEALDAAESGLAVESASLEWKSPAPASDSGGGGSCTFVYIILGACCSAAVLCGLAIVCLRICRRGAVASEPTQTEVKMENAETEKQDNDEEASNAPSTQEPSEGDETRSLGSQASPDVEEPKK